MTAAALSRHKKISCPGQNNNESIAPNNNDSQSTFIQAEPAEIVGNIDISELHMMEYDEMVEDSIAVNHDLQPNSIQPESNEIVQTTDNSDELPVVTEYVEISDSIAVNYDLQPNSIQPEPIETVQTTDNTDELPVVTECVEISDLEKEMLAKLNISMDGVSRVTVRTVKILELTDGSIAFLHDSLNLNGTELSIVPTIDTINA